MNLDAFIGASLDQICLGLHQVSFRFSNEAKSAFPQINVEGQWELLGPNGEVIDRALGDEQLPSERAAYQVHRALGLVVQSYSVRAPESVELTLTGGLVLRVWDDSPHYESFHGEPGGYHI
jgi:hypothetical protein